MKTEQKGFTLLEILLVVAAIAILAGIVIVAINPTKQLGEARNAQRRSDVTVILNAAYQYSIDNNGNLPTGITTTPTEICSTTGAPCVGLVDLGALTAGEKYLTAIPTEPQKVTANGVGYKISRSANNRITVVAQYPEQSATITVTK